jgi:hypothetical protein
MFTGFGLGFPFHASLERLHCSEVLVLAAVLLLKIVLGGHMPGNGLTGILGIGVGAGKVVEALNFGQSLKTTRLLRIYDDDVRGGDIHVE